MTGYSGSVFCGVDLIMIIDTFERGARYSLGPLWNAIYPELMELVRQGDALPDGRYSLAGGPEKGGVMVSVDTYAPKDTSETHYEGHALMADIQAVLSGDEFLDMFPLHGGEAESMRDDDRDLVFYAEKPEFSSRVRLTPGLFALVLPGEAHMPCQKASTDRVKKLVVKIPVKELLVPSFM